MHSINDASLIVQVNVPQVAENTIGVAAIGTVTRPVLTNRPLVVRLDADPSRLIVPATVTIPPNQGSVQFQIATVDNAISGDTADITIRACRLDAVDGQTPVDPGGSTVLTVVDDDSPALTVTIHTALISEGDNLPPRQNIPAALGTVRRNTADTSQPVVVTLTSDNVSKATVQSTVTIPAGASSADFGIFAVWDNMPTGSKVITITATAAGFSAGRGLIAVSDIDKPDLRVIDASAPATARTGQTITLNYTRFNQGSQPAPGGWTDKVYLSIDAILDLGTDVELGSFTQVAGLGPQTQLPVAVNVTLPSNRVGNYYLLVWTDATNVVDEVFETNNVGYTPVPVAIAPAYKGSVTATPHQGVMNSSVVLTGHATLSDTGEPAANVPVTVRVLHESGIRRVLNATTDSLGNYTVTFTPLPGEAGNYSVAAAHPSVTQDVVQDQFTLIGMKVVPPGAANRLVEKQTVSGTFTVTNLSDVPLTNLSWSVIGAPANLVVTVVPPSQGLLAGRANGVFTYSVQALNASVSTANMTLRLTTAEGPTVDVPLSVRVDPITANLQAPSSVSSVMLRNTLTTVDLTISNPGGIATGPIQVLLPGGTPWLSVANADVVAGVPTLPSLAPGASAVVTLLLNPGADLPLGAYTGSLVLAPASGPSARVNYAFQSVSVATGSLKAEVYDELINLETGAPHQVAGATVKLLNVFNGSVAYQGTAGPDGVLTLTNILEGAYNLRVEAGGHDPSVGTITIKPGVENDQTVILRSQQVTYNWSVVPVEYQDRYEVHIESVFATNVPAPVITITPNVIDLADAKFAGGYAQVDFTITNHGLVAAQGMTLTFPGHPLWKITPLISDIGTLPAKSEIVVPAIVQRLGGDPTGYPCSFNGSLDWHVVSFGREVPFSITIPVLNVSDTCRPNYYIPSPPSGGGGGGGGGGGYVPVGGGGGGGYAPIYPSASQPTFNFVTPVEVDAAVRLRIDQEAVMTRTAFAATLDISNGLASTLEGLQVSIFIVDQRTGNDAGDRFALSALTLSNIVADTSGLWAIPARSTGTAKWTLLPNDLAAPTSQTRYSVGGTFSYLLNGQRVSTTMTPAMITVYPDAALTVQYFHQRDVYSDDPWTPQIEPSIPFDLGVMVTNTGAGVAQDLTITSAQPKIVENEKGLLIDFQIVSAQVGNQPVARSLQIDFGDIQPGQTVVGRWQLTSTLQGQFTDYEASFTHVTGLGDLRTSLIKSLSIHELIHTVMDTAPGADTLFDFLTNDIPDPQSLPDTVYLTDGTVQPVGIGSVVTPPAHPGPGAREVTVGVSMPSGYGYLLLDDPNPDPTTMKLGGVRRPDGTYVPFGSNVWTTDRTFTIPFQRPTVENKIHIFDHDGPARTPSCTCRSTRPGPPSPPLIRSARTRPSRRSASSMSPSASRSFPARSPHPA